MHGGSRGAFLTGRLAGAAMLAAISVSAACTTSADDVAPRRPNILVFVTDDQRAEGTLEAMPQVRRWFQDEGIEFTNAFTTTPLCCPARASIFSGRYAHNHGVRHNYQSHELDQSTTIQSYLQEAGYRTAIAGKFLNQWGTEAPPAYFDLYSIFLEGEYYDRQWNLDGTIERLPDYTNDVVRAKALDYLETFEEEDSRPWFLYIGTNAAHAPFTAEPEYRRWVPPAAIPDPAMRERDVSDKPSFGEIRGRKRPIRIRQLRTLRSADDLLRDVMSSLVDHEEIDHTAAIFVSDNGMQWGEHGFTGKRQAYSPSTRIPLFLRWGGRTGRDDRIAANIDIAPTLLDIAGVTVDPRFDGISLVGRSERPHILLEHWKDSETRVWDWASLRSDTYQYIEYYDGDRLRERAYFDLTEDPYQLHNLLAVKGRRPSLVSLRRKLTVARSCMSTTCP